MVAATILKSVKWQ